MARTTKRSGFGLGRLAVYGFVLLLGLAAGYWLGFSHPEWMGRYGDGDRSGKPGAKSVAAGQADAARLEKENTRLQAELQKAREELAEARIRNVLSQGPAQ